MLRAKTDSVLQGAGISEPDAARHPVLRISVHLLYLVLSFQLTVLLNEHTV